MKVKFIYIITLFAVALHVSDVNAQSTFISNIDRTSGSLNQIVTISGRGFDNNPDNLRVFFGGALATIVTASENIIEVQIPANAAYDNISVVNLLTETVVSSKDQFLLSFQGEDFVPAALADQVDNPTGQRGVFDLCVCDFNLDGASDIAVTNNNSETGQQGRINIYSNNSTVGSINLSRNDILLDETTFIECGDLNGDGKPDLVVSEGGSQSTRFYVLENTTAASAITFSTAATIQLPRASNNDIRNINRVHIKDMDNDGKAEIIVSNTTDNLVDIYMNTSASGNISISSDPFQVAVREGVTTSGLDVQDFNNDGFNDIVLTTSRDANLYVLPNTSDIGSLSFDNFIEIAQPGNLVAVKAADLNNDGFSDLVAIDGGVIGNTSDSDDAFVFLNTTATAGGAISFVRNSTLEVNGIPASLDFGDLNGDGLTDVITTSLISSAGSGLSILINTTSGSDITFDSFEAATTSSSRSVRIADIDNDGRPDISFTHDVGIDNSGDLSVILNKNCIIPSITPDESQVICANNDLILQATESNGSTYKWELSIDGGAFSTILETGATSLNAQDYLNPGQSGNFRVTLTSDAGACENTSNTVSLVVNGDVVNPPVPTANGPVCPGSELVLTSNVTGSSVLYEWTSPDGTTETVTDPEYRIPNFQNTDAGRYELVIQSGSCRSAAGSVIVASRSLPFVRIDDNRNNLLCTGETRQLSITTFAGFTYQWKLNGSELSGETGTTLTISNGGTYTVEITDETGCSEETPPTVIENVPAPVPSVDAESEICEGVALTFNATSTGATGFILGHRWDFGDGGNDTGATVDHTYGAPGTYNVVLTTFYEGFAGCEESTTFPVVVRASPDYDITTPNPDGFEKCPSETIRLELPDNFISYEWSTGSTENFAIGATEDGESQGTVSVIWTDDVGCSGRSEVTYSNFANSELIITSEFTIDNDTIRLEEGIKSVDLSVSFGTDLIWEPEEVVEINSSTDVTVFPSTSFTNVIATGTTTNSCRESANVVIVNNFLVPRKTFSPNGDGLGFECWEILNASILDGCTVYIFDSKGTIIKEINTPFSNDNCIWDGTTEGRQAPEGVYYYVLKCQDTEFNRSGSILLAR